MPSKRKATTRTLEQPVGQKEEEQPPTLMFPLCRPALVDTNASLRTIGKILQNGARFSPHAQINFNRHSNLMIELRNAFELRTRNPEQAEQTFLRCLQTYLEEARGHIPHTFGTQEQIELALQDVRLLLTHLRAENDTNAFEHVASYVLLLAHSGFDRF